MMRRAAASLLLLLAGFIGGLVVTARLRSASESRASAPVAARQAGAARSNASLPPVAPVPSAGPDFTRVAAEDVKGVANISSLQVVRTERSPLSEDEFFRYFFGDNDVFGSRDRRALSLGSGVIISADGYIVTNNHVIGENIKATSAEITVSLPNKREIRGKIVGTDPTTDIALVKIAMSGLPVVPWGDSSQLKVGEWVLAIGSPFQLSQTVTAGIVSATGRADIGFADYEDFIQTDAAINPGNSGGALVNTRGELIGINTGIFSQSGGYQGIGFAVPSNLARHVVDDLMKYGEVRRGSIGYIGIERLTPQLAEEVGATNLKGAVVTRMRRDTQAFEAGLRPGDVIVAFNGQRVDEPSQLSRMVADARIGGTAVLKILRSGRSVEIKLPIISAARQRR